MKIQAYSGRYPLRKLLLSLSLCLGATVSAQARVEPVKPHVEREAVVAYIANTFGKSKQLAIRIADSVYRETSKVGLPPLLAFAIIEIESSFSPTAANASGATGLMQVIGRYHQDKIKAVTGPQSLTHPETNIQVGVGILKEYLAKAGGDLSAALLKYSGGSLTYASKVEKARTKLGKVTNAHSIGLIKTKSDVAEPERNPAPEVGEGAESPFDGCSSGLPEDASLGNEWHEVSCTPPRRL